MTGRRRGGLRPDERELWEKVAATARPMPGRGGAPLAADAATSGTAAAMQKGHAVRVPADGAGRRAGAADARPEPATHAPRMDAKAYRRMVRGKSPPEARIDLHGMSLAVAHSELTSFVLRGHAEGLRLLLVITGKGARTGVQGDGSRGILNRQVPHWLCMPPLSAVVLDVATAHRVHGGSGALYVYLRRNPVRSGRT